MPRDGISHVVALRRVREIGAVDFRELCLRFGGGLMVFSVVYSASP